MATTMARFKIASAQPFCQQPDTNNATDGHVASVANHTVAKDETSQRLQSCPYANGEERNEEQQIANEEQAAEKTSPARSLSPEFLLGSAEKANGSRQKEPKTNKGAAKEVINPGTCVYCNEIFPSKAQLEQHVKNEHSGSGKNLYNCSVCEKRFTHRSSRDVHLRVHTGQRPYECDYCKKRFRVSSHLRDHVRTHTGERPFICGVCGRGFKQSSDMKKHRKTHFKSMPANPPINTERGVASYMIVRPQETATAVDHSPNDLRSPTDQRHNLKLVIKRERKSTDVSPTRAKNVSDNGFTIPQEKFKEDTTQHGERAEKTENSRELQGNTNLAPISCYPYENGISTIRYTKESCVRKNLPETIAVKRKVTDKQLKNHNSYKQSNSYPSMASGFGQVFTSAASICPAEPQVTTPQNTVRTHQSNETGNIQIGNRPSCDLHQPTTQIHNQNGEHEEVDDVFWQPSSKVIKTEKLSPNPHEQLPYCHEQSTANREQPAPGHELPTYGNGNLTGDQDMHEREQLAHGYEQTSSGRELPPYTQDWPIVSEDTKIDVVAEQTLNVDLGTATNEQFTNSSRITTVSPVAEQQTDDIPTEETEILENNGAVFQENSQLTPDNVTSNTKAIARKPMVVKLRRENPVGGIKKNATCFSVRKPIKLKGQQEALQCALCEEIFKNLEAFTAHKCGKNGKTFKCTICNKIFARSTLLRQHMVLHQGSKRFRFKCNYCGRAFRHRSHLRDHERIHTGERPFKCSFCPKAFKQSSDHRKHENLHTGTTRYRCEKCSLDFKRCDALKRHAMMHTEGEVTLLKCEKCRSLFATADGHMSHVCLNRPYRYRCQICPERFTDADDLRRHCYQQHGEQSTLSCLKCEFCKMEFNSLKELDKHLGTHRLEKTHKCRTCDERFSLLNQLVEHVKMHNIPPLSKEGEPSSVITSSSLNQSESSLQNRSEQASLAATPRLELNQPLKNFRDLTQTGKAAMSDNQSRQRFDFIPSRYQSLVHTNPIYGEMAVGNWGRPNFYMPIRPKDAIPGANVDSRGQDVPVSPRDNPIASRSKTEVSRTHPISSRSAVEVYRRNTESSEISPMSSERGPNDALQSTTIDKVKAYLQTSPTINTFPDEIPTPSFAAYHAIALSRTAFRASYPRDRRNEARSSHHESTSSDQRTPTSTASTVNVDKSPVREVRTRVVQRNRNYPEVSQIDSEEKRSYSEQARMYPEEVQINSEGIRKNSEGSQSGPMHIQGNFTSGRESTEITEQHTAVRRTSSGSSNSHRQRVESHSAQSPRGQSVVKRKYTCLNCRLEFYRESSLVDHVCDILSETLYCCLVCEEHYENYEDLQKHMRTHWRQVVHFKCTLCGHRVRTEESLKEHNMKHVEDARAERHESEGHDEVHTTAGAKDGYQRIANEKARDDGNDPTETFISLQGSTTSVTSPVIYSVNDNIVSKTTVPGSERVCKDRRMDVEVSQSMDSTNQNALSVRDDVTVVTPRSTHDSYIPFYEARKQAPANHHNMFGQGPAIVVSAIHATMESGRYPALSGPSYPPALTRPGYTAEHN